MRAGLIGEFIATIGEHGSAAFDRALGAILRRLLEAVSPHAPERSYLRGPESSVATEAVRSVHTANLPALFDELNISLVVSTYQAGASVFAKLLNVSTIDEREICA
ncbi:MAG: TIGR03032 family protein [Pseudomonadota bacterium]|nr:TIGR03032 family protein [Pseudomonadota bacterium]